MSDRELPIPQPGEESAWVAEHLSDLGSGQVRPAGISGGQQAADIALDGFDVAGYARRRNEVWPTQSRGASRLSAYIRHGLLDLPRVWQHVEGGPDKDVESFRGELLWQEYARHLYARLGRSTGRSLRFAVPERDDHPGGVAGKGMGDDSGMACIEASRSELRDSGWLTNQQRMWLASQHSVREGHGWREGEDEFFRWLIDGSRAANRLGWQWSVGALTGKQYGFSRWQVDKRAPGLCDTCRHRDACPIEQWPPEVSLTPRAVVDPLMRKDPDLPSTRGPLAQQVHGDPQVVWITAESLGDDDPAMAAWPDLPVVFVFDVSLLTRLRLAAHRLVFLTECLADLATRRPVRIWRGHAGAMLGRTPLATTFAPVPGWRTRSQNLDVVALHPWRWLVPPHSGPVTSFTAWRRRAGV